MPWECRRQAIAATANRQGDGVSLFLKKEELQELISLLSVVCTCMRALPLSRRATPLAQNAPDRSAGCDACCRVAGPAACPQVAVAPISVKAPGGGEDADGADGDGDGDEAEENPASADRGPADAEQ
jgi:hypothetical protein